MNDKKSNEEDTLQRLKGVIQKSLDNIEDPILVVSPDYHLLFVNRAVKRASVYKDPVSSNLECYHVVHHLERPCDLENPFRYPCPLKKVIATKNPTKTRHIIIDGEIIEVISFPIFDEKGDILGIFLTYHDNARPGSNITALEGLVLDIQGFLARIKRISGA